MARKRADVSNAQIGALVRAARLKARLTQADLGDKIGTTYQNVSHYENGTVAISALQLIEIAKAVGCKTRDLIP